MVHKRKIKIATKEAVVDTALGTAIMAPLNYLIIDICLNLNFNSFQIALSTTTLLFLIAVFRKCIIRLYFQSKYEDTNSK